MCTAKRTASTYKRGHGWHCLAVATVINGLVCEAENCSSKEVVQLLINRSGTFSTFEKKKIRHYHLVCNLVTTHSQDIDM